MAGGWEGGRDVEYLRRVGFGLLRRGNQVVRMMGLGDFYDCFGLKDGLLSFVWFVLSGQQAISPVSVSISFFEHAFESIWPITSRSTFRLLPVHVPSPH